MKNTILILLFSGLTLIVYGQTNNPPLSSFENFKYGVNHFSEVEFLKYNQYVFMDSFSIDLLSRFSAEKISDSLKVKLLKFNLVNEGIEHLKSDNKSIEIQENNKDFFYIGKQSYNIFSNVDTYLVIFKTGYGYDYSSSIYGLNFCDQKLRSIVLLASEINSEIQSVESCRSTESTSFVKYEFIYNLQFSDDKEFSIFDTRSLKLNQSGFMEN